jgi:hypothetical protein
MMNIGDRHGGWDGLGVRPKQQAGYPTINNLNLAKNAKMVNSYIYYKGINQKYIIIQPKLSQSFTSGSQEVRGSSPLSSTF